MTHENGTSGGVGPTGGSAFLSVSKDGWTGGIQLSICDESGSGFRIHGPKFNGSGKNLVDHKLTQRDADEIRRYLDRAFPPNIVHETARRTDPSQMTDRSE